MDQISEFDTFIKEADELYIRKKSGYAALYRKAAERGDGTAMFKLGYCLANGYDIAKDEEEAFCWYEKSAKAGNAFGQYYASTCLARGIGCRIDPNQALLYARKAEKNNNPDAASLITEIENYMRRVPNEEKYRYQDHMMSDIRELRRIVSRIVNRNFRNDLLLANQEQLKIIGEVKHIEDEWSLKFMRMRAERGDTGAMLTLGLLHFEKDPQEVNSDPDEGYRYLMMAAKCGCLPAMEWLIALFSGGKAGPHLPKPDPSIYRSVREEPDFVWSLLRMFSWIHVKGILTVENWYEIGNLNKEPDYVAALEACRGAIDYRVFPKKYLDDFKNLYDEEKEYLFRQQNALRMSLLNCLSALAGDNYTEQAKEVITEIIAEDPAAMQDVGILLAARDRVDLIDFAACSIKEAAEAASGLYTSGSAYCRHLQSELSGEVDFEKAVYFRFCYYAKKYQFETTLAHMIRDTRTAYMTRTADGLLMILHKIKEFNALMKGLPEEAPLFEESCLALLRPKADDIALWREKKLHGLQMRGIDELREGRKIEEIRSDFAKFELCYPAVEALFPMLPILSSRESRMTYYEELIDKNYDLSKASFEAKNRLDICFDHKLWELTVSARGNAQRLISAGQTDWELPDNYSDLLDQEVENYLEKYDGKVTGLWPTLLPITILRFRYRDKNSPYSKEVVHSTRKLNYRAAWLFPEEWKGCIRQDRADLDVLRHILSTEAKKDSESAAEKYVRKLLYGRDLAAYRSDLYRFYRSICFRGLWHEAYFGEESCPCLKEWQLLYQEFAKHLINLL